MVALLQAFLRLLIVAIAAIGTWAGVELNLPGDATEEARHEASRSLREHTADVFARIEAAGIANPPSIFPEASAEGAPVPRPVSPTAPETKAPSLVAPGAYSDTKFSPQEEGLAETETAEVAEVAEVAEPNWIETKLPPGLYDPVGGEAAKVAGSVDNVTLAKNTTVNLACVRKEGSALRITSGSGVVVSPDGLIMTDAHVAYYFLLGEDGVGCSITHPSYPIFGYPGQVVYVSPDWVKRNKQIIGGTHTTATGEEDYAFVSFAPGSAPARNGNLNFAPVSVNEPVAKVGDVVTVSGYPGAAATPEGYGAATRLKVDDVQIVDVDSFSQKTADILQTVQTPVAASGSSGGGAFLKGNLVGLTVTVYPLGGGYGINSLSTAWINRDMRADAGISIADLIEEDLDEAAASFWDAEGAALAKIVRAALGD